MTLDKMKRLCASFRVNNYLVFQWFVSDTDGAWLSTASTVSNTMFEIIKERINDAGFDMLEWLFKDGLLKIRIGERR